ncbi:MAG: MraY family glycosyltransferase [Candidatus Saganbacteria bacterium]|nr:MraY family glycosyltransferase [Candidatus Saganbacteria bacterium]
MTDNFFIILPLVLVISILTTFILQWLSYKFGLFSDKPNRRSSHSNIIPRCGGVTFLILFAVFIFPLFDLKNSLNIAYLAGAAAFLVVGLSDDLSIMKGSHKIAATFAAAFIPIIFGVRLDGFGLGFDAGIFSYMLTFLWIFGLINAFNFMDGIDGLIGGISLISSFVLLAFSLISGNITVAMVSTVIIAGCLGFLLFNYSPASIFLGDTGSLFLGYNFAVLSIFLANSGACKVQIYPFVILFAPVIYDSLSTVIRRAWEGKNLIEAHRDHLYQKLIIHGYSHRSISIIYYVLTIFLGYISIMSRSMLLSTKIPAMICLLFFLAAGSVIAERLGKKHAKKHN